MASSSAHSPKIYASDHRPSVSTMGGFTAESEDDSDDTGSRYTTPPPGEVEPAEPRTPEAANLDGARPEQALDSDAEQSLAAMAGSPASRTKQRRSLHRTLRDGSGTHRRSHKGRDSASTIVSDDGQESEGLTRGKGSFTVHGKKASVIQFGGDWHSTTAEERLKTKKQLQEAAEAATSDERDGNSIASNGTTSIMSPANDAADYFPPARKLSADAVKQRHVSSQTITPANFLEAREEQVSSSDDDSEMSDIAEEDPSKLRTSVEQPKDSEKPPTFLDYSGVISETPSQA